MTYKTMYERLIDQGQNTVQGYIAYGLYKNAKRQWLAVIDSNTTETQNLPK